ncbi:phosphatase PAP2 family protein [Microbispora amethystogenes]|uniref:phosphatase PAP2 family protein n=1 Tax=Microbispora amethystogenes TaxID=1427754 RepID=UPI001952BEA3|nr:phosphatase PAP2 family protein [Microbispora amethystogenes]
MPAVTAVPSVEGPDGPAYGHDGGKTVGVEVEDVPDISAEWYREVVAFAADTPAWVRHAMEIATDVVPALVVVFLAVGWWRARREDDRRMALALLAPVAVLVPYLASEGIKSLLRLRRPCWDLAGAVTVAPCPPYGDWSLPSNHATFAAAGAVALAVLWRRTAPAAGLLAVAEAFSRVFVGVHYPHDVMAGSLLGAVTAPLVLLVLRGPAVALVVTLRRRPVLAPVLTTRAGRLRVTRAERGLGAGPAIPRRKAPPHAR